MDFTVFGVFWNAAAAILSELKTIIVYITLLLKTFLSEKIV